MKIRQGFVTNSSSSSYIIATYSKSGDAIMELLKRFAENSYYSDIEIQRKGSYEDLCESYLDGTFDMTQEEILKIHFQNGSSIYDVELQNWDNMNETIRELATYCFGFDIICSGRY